MTYAEDFDNADTAMERRCQNIPAFHAGRGLDDALPVHSDAARLDQFRSDTARFYKSRMPQPLIEALLFR